VAPDSFHALDHRHLAVDLDPGTQAHQFVDVHEAVFKNGFGHLAGTLRHTVERHELGLHVGRKTGVFGGAKALRLEPPVELHPDAVFGAASTVAPASRSLSITASR
jgi:hypothetical protein